MDNPLSRDLDHILEHTEHLWADARGERFFLTGGTGFVGTWLVESLLWANRRLSLGIRAVVLTRDPQAFARRSPHLASRIELRWGDCTAFDYPTGAPVGAFPFVVHAASAGYASTMFSEMQSALSVAEFARAHAAKRLLFTSSGAVGTGSPYAKGKDISESILWCLSQKFGFDALIARLYAFIGPGLPLDRHYAAGNFIRDALKGGPIRTTGDGTPLRSYLYAADLAIWLWTILFRGRTGRVYNVGSNQEISIRALAAAISIEAGSCSVDVSNPPGSRVERYVPDITRAQIELGLRVWIPLDEAIRRTLRWHRGQSAGR